MLRAAALALLAHRPVGLFTDVDGTIAPLVSRPDLARVRPSARRSLARLARALPVVAILTGRPALEARRMVRVAGAVYVGNHGLERLHGRHVTRPPEAEAAAAALASITPLLRQALRGEPGLLFEPKGPLLGIHYRNATDPAAARARIVAACGAIAPPGLRIAEGKHVVELQPAAVYDKGLAVRTLVAEHHLGGLILLGDDRTDVSAFAAGRALREQGVCHALIVGVAGPEPAPEVLAAADHTLRDVGAVERFLSWLADAVAG